MLLSVSAGNIRKAAYLSDLEMRWALKRGYVKMSSFYQLWASPGWQSFEQSWRYETRRSLQKFQNFVELAKAWSNQSIQCKKSFHLEEWLKAGKYFSRSEKQSMKLVAGCWDHLKTLGNRKFFVPERHFAQKKRIEILEITDVLFNEQMIKQTSHLLF